MIKLFILTILLSVPMLSLSQEDLAEARNQEIPEMKVDLNFKSKYNRQLYLLRRSYPMALKAKELIDEYEADLIDIDKNRKKKRYSKKAHKKLKEEFTYNVRDLYQSEGELLMQLVYRETGMTVNEVIKNYRGGFQTTMYGGIAKIFGQNLDATYNKKEDDWITEIVIQDIISGNVDFDTSMRKMDKKAYKSSMKDYRGRKKTTRKKIKKMRRDLKTNKK